MIIRSQNKKELHNLDGIKMIRIVTNSQNFFIEVNGQHDIGVYSTEEKAIKVLDMIQKRYSEFCCNEFCSVFEMPQDSEV